MIKFCVLPTLLARCALICALTVSMGWTADPPTAADATVSLPQPTAAASWGKLDTEKPWELKLAVNAGSPFKAGTAASTSAGVEVWQTTADTEALASFTGKLPSNKPRKTYEPKFTGQFKAPDGATATASGPLPVWLVNGRFTITCDYEKSCRSRARVMGSSNSRKNMKPMKPSPSIARSCCRTTRRTRRTPSLPPCLLRVACSSTRPSR